MARQIEGEVNYVIETKNPWVSMNPPFWNVVLTFDYNAYIIKATLYSLVVVCNYVCKYLTTLYVTCFWEIYFLFSCSMCKLSCYLGVTELATDPVPHWSHAQCFVSQANHVRGVLFWLDQLTYAVYCAKHRCTKVITFNFEYVWASCKY